MRLAVRSAASAQDGSRRSATVSRQISTPAEASSMRLSTPKAVRLMLRAMTPEARATTASMIIHVTVNHSSRNSARISSARGAAAKFARPATLLVVIGRRLDDMTNHVGENAEHPLVAGLIDHLLA